MIKIDWSEAPDEATHYLHVDGIDLNKMFFYKIDGDETLFLAPDLFWKQSGHSVESLERGGDSFYHFIPRIKLRIRYNAYALIEWQDDPLTVRFIKEQAEAYVKLNLEPQSTKLPPVFIPFDWANVR